MSNEVKPREWWFPHNWQTETNLWAVKCADSIHVIEYFAYEKEVTRSAKLVEALKLIDEITESGLIAYYVQEALAEYERTNGQE